MLPLSLIWSLAGGIALVILGVWVVRLSPRRPVNVAIAVFVVAAGMRPMIADFGEHFGIITWFVEGPFLLASTTVLAWLALRFPEPASPGVRRAALAGGVVAVVGLLAGHPGLLANLFNVYLLAFLVPLVALPVRAILSSDAQTAGRAAALGSALTLYPGAFAAFAFLGLVDAFDTRASYYVAAVTLLAATPALAGLWLYASYRGPAAGPARTVALFILAVPLLVALNYLYGPRLPATDIARIATALLLVVAIMRGQLLGTDAALRWTISRSAIAAAFIAMFFVASEAAQQFFGDQFESGYLGILAAGVLVFAIAPLSRLAERFAEKAVPVTNEGADPRRPSRPDPEAAYRKAIRLALRDRGLSREDQVELAELAEALGIGAGRAASIIREVERESEVRVG